MALDTLDTILCDQVCQWFSLGTLVSSTNKTDGHSITVALNTITLTLLLWQENDDDVRSILDQQV